jgi:PPM family protein phosphatase
LPALPFGDRPYGGTLEPLNPRYLVIILHGIIKVQTFNMALVQRHNHGAGKDKPLERKSFEITCDSKTFTVPGSAKTRVSQWQEMSPEIQSGFHGIFVLAQALGDDIHDCEVSLDRVKESFKSGYFEECYYIFDENEQLEEKMRGVLSEINRTLYALGKSTGQDKRVSILLGILWGNTLFIAHVGSCRAIYVRNGGIHTITVLQDFFPPPLHSPTLTVNQARAYSEKMSTLSMLGNELVPPIDIHKFTIQDNDIVLIMSDVISETVKDDEMQSYVSESGELDGALSRVITLSTDRNNSGDCAIMGLKFMPFKEPDESLIDTGELDERKTPARASGGQAPLPSKGSRMKKMSIFIISMVITVLLGYLYLMHEAQRSLETPTKLTIFSTLPMKRISWMGRECLLEKGFTELHLLPEESGILEIEPDRKSYGCLVSISARCDQAVQVENVMGTLPKNQLIFARNRINIRVNLFSRIDPMNPEFTVQDKEDAPRLFIGEFNLGNLKGPLEVSFDKHRPLEEIRFLIRKYD